MKLHCCLSLLLIHVAIGIHDLQSEFRFTADLAGDDYVLHWNVDMENEEITFGVNASTTGWVGFGVSPNGQMPGSDVVIAWVNNDGQVFFQVSSSYVLYTKSCTTNLQDRHAIGRFLPPVDDSQDWTIISGEEINGRTILEFSRPFLSCDTENDLNIKVRFTIK